MKKKRLLKLVWISLVLALLFPAACEEATLRQDSPQASWQFVVVGDSRSDGQNNGVNIRILGELAAEIAKQNVDFVLFLGDLVSGEVRQARMETQFSTWLKIMKPVYGAGISVYPVRGRIHDEGKPEGTSAWDKFFGYLPDNGPAGEKNLTYSFTHKNALVIGVDQCVRPSRVNQIWLDEQLAANTKSHIFVFGHEPAFKADHEDCLDDYPANRDRFWASIEKAGGRTYFCGHDHFYNHARVDDDGNPGNDIHQYLVGAAGAPLYDFSGNYDGDNTDYTVENVNHAKEYGYVLVEIAGLDVTLTWIERVDAAKYKAKEVWSYKAGGRSRQPVTH